jgi:hypothetical protein
MGQHTPRTEAEELRDVRAALSNAQRALRDLRSHLDTIVANPEEGAAGKALAARHNADIVAAELAAAGQAASALGRAQLTVVS